MPSVKNNNDLKDKAVTELKKLIYKLEKNKYSEDLDKVAVSDISTSLKNSTENLYNSLGTGEENLDVIFKDIIRNIDEVEKQSRQKLLNRFESAVDELNYSINLWKDISEGEAFADESELKKLKISWKKKTLNLRLNELSEIKQAFLTNDSRIKGQINILEKDLNELDNKIINEDNERKINELYREISSIKSKIDMMTVRSNNYSACFNILDIIYANASEIITASDFSDDEIGKAKALLNISKLKNVLNEPDKAISILKRMEEDVKKIFEKTRLVDNKIFGLNTGSITISDDAMSYKEKLMKKKRDKEMLVKNNSELENGVVEEKSIKGEN